METIEQYLATLSVEWQQEVCKELCRLVSEADPSAKPNLKNGAPVFEHNGELCSVYAGDDSVSIAFAKGKALPYSPLFGQAEPDSPIRAITILERQMVPAQEIIGFVREAVKLNEAS